MAKFEWKRPLGLAETPYAYRWKLTLLGGWSLRLHHWLSDDDHEALHDHPTWFWTFILRGGYTDVSHDPEKDMATFETMRAGYYRFRPAEHRHQVLHVQPNTWTLCLFGKEGRRWSFFDAFTQKAWKRDKYFAEIGHHTPDGGRVRLRPDGRRI